MATAYTRPQIFQRPKLKLFDGALGPAEFFCDLANTLLLDETFDDDRTLIVRKIAAFDLLPTGPIEIVGNRIGSFLGDALPAICDRIRSDAKQPSSERHAPPLESQKICQGVLKHFRCQVLRFMPVAHAPDDKRVNALKVVLIEVGKAARILLRGLDQQTFLLHYLYKLPEQAKSHGLARISRRNLG